jgi:hypothetical protein
MKKYSSIVDPLGNVGLLSQKGTDKEPIFIVKRASEPKPIPAWILEKRANSKSKKEPNGHELDAQEIARSVTTNWRAFFNGKSK